jgi:gliding motility-associated-like protein
MASNLCSLPYAIRGFFRPKRCAVSLFKLLLCGCLINALAINGFSQPTISGFNPISGPVGTVVTITGSNFSTVPSENIVYFGATMAKVTAASTGSLTVTVPPGSTFRPLSVTTNQRTAYSAYPFNVTFGTACGQPIYAFSAVLTQPTLAYPRHISANDIDGDGKADLVVTDHNQSGFSIYRNSSGTGTIALAAAASFTSGEEPFASAVGDLDGDGRPDVVSCSYPLNKMFIFKNTSTPGAVSFAAKIEINTALNPKSTAITDLDKDGRPEIILLNQNAHSVSVFKNITTGGIAFDTRVDIPVGKWPSNLTVADFDGDGYTDIAASNYDDNSVSILLNTSSNNNISFTPKKDFPVNAQVFWLTSADLDLDGKPEILLANDKSSSISVLKNSSSPGNVSFDAPLNINVGLSPLFIDVADMNGNGKPDIVVVNFGGNNIQFLNNTSTMSTLSFDNAGTINTGMLPRAVAIADLDADNKPDLAVVNSIEHSMTILKNVIATAEVTLRTQAPTCLGSNGGIVVDILGGPYEFSINGLPYQQSNTFTGLPSGIYTIRIKDASNCVSSLTANLTSSDFLAFTLTLVPTACGKNNGSLTINASGNNPPILYSINGTDYQTSPEFKDLPAGVYNAYVKDNNGCTRRHGFTISTACVTITASSQPATCNGANGTMEIHASGGTSPYSYSVNNSPYQTANIFTGLPAASYKVTVRDALGVTETIEAKIANTSGPQLSIVRHKATGCANATGELELKATGGSSPFRYTVDGTRFQTDSVFTGMAAGNYSVAVMDANGCRTTINATVAAENNVTANAGNDTTICEGSSIKIAAVSDGQSFQWTPAAGVTNSTVLQPNVSPASTTTYTLTAKTGSCITTSKVTVTVNKAPVASAGNDTTICLGKDVRLQAATGAAAYSWSPALYLQRSDVPDPLISRPPAGKHVFNLRITDGNGCTSLTPDAVTVTVTEVKIFAGNDTIAATGEAFQLHVADFSNTLNNVYNWSPSVGLDNSRSNSPVATLQEDITYRVTVTTPEGCSGDDLIHIKVYKGPEIYVPNAFSPNGDGKNDVLRAIAVGIRTFVRFSIYNRWGEIIFTTTDASKGWNGIVKDKMQSGGYVWIAEGVDFKGKRIIRRGTVLIIR